MVGQLGGAFELPAHALSVYAGGCRYDDLAFAGVPATALEGVAPRSIGQRGIHACRVAHASELVAHAGDCVR